MKNIFPGYVEIEAPASDTERVKWRSVMPGIVGDYVEDMAMRDRSLASVDSMNDKVNNLIKYKPDDARDHWQMPQETVDKLSGDCEDFAILKYAILRNSGFWGDQLALVLGEIASLSGNKAHAFLVVEVEGARCVLDNKFDQLIDPKNYANFIPKKVVNDNGVFLYSKQFTIAETTKHT